MAVNIGQAAMIANKIGSRRHREETRRIAAR